MNINKWTHRPIITTALIACSLLTFSQSAIADEVVTVTPEMYIRAETDRSFSDSAMSAGGVNLFDHHRAPPPVDQQPIVRMNKDTLYSEAIVDTEGGATVTVPEISGGRYVSVLLIDNDHYVPSVIYTAGTHFPPSSGIWHH